MREKKNKTLYEKEVLPLTKVGKIIIVQYDARVVLNISRIVHLYLFLRFVYFVVVYRIK